MDHSETSTSVKELAQALANNLEKEERILKALRTHIDAQLVALRNQQRSQIEELTDEASRDVHSLQLLQAQREDHVHALRTQLGLDPGSNSIDELIKVLKTIDENNELFNAIESLREQIPSQAEITRNKCKELAYSLQYALHIGHQFIEAIQGATSYPPMLVYTAAGSKKVSATKRMMVNKVG